MNAQNGLNFDSNGALLVSGGPSTADIVLKSRMPKWRVALSKVLANAGQAKIAFVGDSVTSGTQGGGALLFVNSYAYRCAAMLNARGFAARTDAITGGHSSTINSPAAYNTFDPRVTMGANVSPLGSFAGYGYAAFNDQTGTGIAADTLVFTPTGAFDRIDCYFYSNPSWGSMTVNVDGGASLGTLNCNAALAWNKTTFSPTRVTGGTHAINVVGTGISYIHTVHAYDSTVSAIQLLNFGINGASSASYGGATFPWDAGTTGSLAKYAPDLTFIYLGLNDCSAATSTTAYTTNIQYYINEAKQTGDVVLVGLWGNINDATDILRQNYTNALKSLAANNNISMIDFFPLYGSSSNSTTLGITDGLHPTATGEADMANVVVNFITSFA